MIVDARCKGEKNRKRRVIERRLARRASSTACAYESTSCIAMFAAHGFRVAIGFGLLSSAIIKMLRPAFGGCMEIVFSLPVSYGPETISLIDGGSQ